MRGQWSTVSASGSIFASGAVLSLCTCLACAPAAGRPDPVVVDGSSTVYPLSEAVAEDFLTAHPEVRVTVGVSGSGGGFQRFCHGELDVTGASRTISAAEAGRCREAGIHYLALPVARDGITFVVNPENDAVRCLSLSELRVLWEPSSSVTTWRDLRPELPAEEIRFFGPGTDSGTFDFFTTVVVGRVRASRADYYQTEDDFLVAQGVAGDAWALGYFGHAYFVRNQGRLRALEIDTGLGCVPPSQETIGDGRYSPLIRDLYLYVRRDALSRPDVVTFVDYYLQAGESLAASVGYVGLPAAEYVRNRALLRASVPGPA